MNSYYDTMQVCKKWGHLITEMYDTYPNQRQKRCDKCGSETAHICVFCNSKIRGYYHVEGVIGGSIPMVPLNCHECGKSYPWRKKLLVKKLSIKAVSPIKYIFDGFINIFKK